MKKSQWKALRHLSLRSLQNNKQLLMSLLPLLRKCKKMKIWQMLKLKLRLKIKLGQKKRKKMSHKESQYLVTSSKIWLNKSWIWGSDNTLLKKHCSWLCLRGKVSKMPWIGSMNIWKMPISMNNYSWWENLEKEISKNHTKATCQKKRESHKLRLKSKLIEKSEKEKQK